MRASRASRAAALSIALAACGGGDGDDGDGDGGEPPFGAAEREWTWVDVDGSRCMDGSATGIGVNLDGSAHLVLFLEGGGGCYDAASCAAVAHQDGFGPDELAAFAAGGGRTGIFDRGDPANPLAGSSHVLVPYCSGDTHAGASPSGPDGRLHDGFANLSRAATLVAGQLDGIERVLLVGQSAGGFGATLDFDMVQRIFGDVPVDLLDDSGPPLPDAYMTPCLQTIFRDAWNLDATVPADCAACAGADGGGLVNLVGFLAEKYPASRFGMVSSLADRTIRGVYGTGYPDCEDPGGPMPAEAFAAGVAELRDDVMAPLANAAAFTIDSDQHVWTQRPLGEIEVSGTTLGSWIGQLVSGADSWDSLAP
jgi:Pectinacetylesterase